MALQSVTRLATITLQNSANEVTFSSIPNTYRDLILVVSGNPTPDGGAAGVRLNGDSSTANYTTITMAGNNNNAPYSATKTSDGYMSFTPDFSWDSGQQNQAIMQILDYTATNKHKSALTRRQGGGLSPTTSTHRWASTAVVNSLTVLIVGSRFFAAGSVFSLYGRIA